MIKKLAKVIIFDFDGTIIDSAPVVCDLLNSMRKERGLKPLPFDILKSYLSRGGSDLVNYALEISGATTEMVAEFRRRYARLPASDDILYPTVHEMLQSLRAAGIYICICTNKPRNLVEKILNELELMDQFDFINAGGDLPNKKPHVSNVQACLNFAGAQASEAVLVGDSIVDQDSAMNAKVPFYFFSSGYDDGVDQSKASFVFHYYPQLLSHFGLK